MALWAAGLLLLAIVLTSCATASAKPSPPAIRYGEDVSVGCGMIISDPRFATAALPADGDPLLFDDVGDYLAYAQAHRLRPRVVFVHDFNTKEWLRAEDAWFVLSPRIETPMASGLAAFATEVAGHAEQAKTGGQILRWTDLLARDWSSKALAPSAIARGGNGWSVHQ